MGVLVSRVESTADAAGTVRETYESDNSKSVYVRLAGDDVRIVPRPGNPELP